MKQPPTVFVVDDRNSVLDSLKIVLNSNGYHVECITSAAEFIAKLNSDQVGCVVIEPLMNASGYTVLRWLHKSGSLLSVVLVSGLIDSADYVRQASEPRITDKPYAIWALLTMVNDGLAGSLSRKAVRDRGRPRG